MKVMYNEMERVLSQDIEISKTVENRIKDTYKILEERSVKMKRAKHSYKKYIAAAGIIFALSGTTAFAAYMTDHKEFLNTTLGTENKQSTKPEKVVVDDGDGKKEEYTLPASEYVPLDADKMKMVEPYILDIGKEVQLGKHKLTILNHISDGRMGIVSYKLECESGVDMLTANEDTNRSKGANIAETSKYYFNLGSSDNFIAGKLYLDQKKSTKNCYYLYDSYVSDDSTKGADLSYFELNHSYAEEAKTKEESKIINQSVVKFKSTEMPRTKVLSEDKKSTAYEFSPLGLSFNDEQFIKYKTIKRNGETMKFVPTIDQIIIHFKDGTDYVLYDGNKNIDNTGYRCGGMGETKNITRIAFNRVIDPANVKSLTVNKKTIEVDK